MHPYIRLLICSQLAVLVSSMIGCGRAPEPVAMPVDRAKQLVFQQDLDGALAECDRILGKDPQDLEVLLVKEEILRKQSKIDKAITAATNAIIAAPKDARAYKRRADLLLEKSKSANDEDEKFAYFDRSQEDLAVYYELNPEAAKAMAKVSARRTSSAAKLLDRPLPELPKSESHFDELDKFPKSIDELAENAEAEVQPEEDAEEVPENSFEQTAAEFAEQRRQARNAIREKELGDDLELNIPPHEDSEDLIAEEPPFSPPPVAQTARPTGGDGSVVLPNFGSSVATGISGLPGNSGMTNPQATNRLPSSGIVSNPSLGQEFGQTPLNRIPAPNSAPAFHQLGGQLGSSSLGPAGWGGSSQSGVRTGIGSSPRTLQTSFQPQGSSSLIPPGARDTFGAKLRTPQKSNSPEAQPLSDDEDTEDAEDFENPFQTIARGSPLLLDPLGGSLPQPVTKKRATSSSTKRRKLGGATNRQLPALPNPGPADFSKLPNFGNVRNLPGLGRPLAVGNPPASTFSTAYDTATTYGPDYSRKQTTLSTSIAPLGTESSEGTGNVPALQNRFNLATPPANATRSVPSLPELPPLGANP